MNSLDVLRTRLRDMLFGRTRVKVVTLDKQDDVVPVFLVGTFRSGTTLFRFMLDSHSEICCPPETKFLEHLAAMYADPSTMNAFSSMGFNDNFIRGQMKSFASSVYGVHLKAMDKQYVIDKTPDYVRRLEFIDWLYEGKCKYILIYRNGLDVAHSMNAMHIKPIETGKSVSSAFEYWKYDTETMLEWEETHQSQCHRVIYDQLCDDTASILNEVMEFIGLQFEQEQLKWFDQPHSRGDEDIKARRQRRINKSVHNYQSWPQELTLDLKQRSSDIHRAIGYNPESLELT